MRIGTYELEWPFMNAGGLVKTPEAAEAMARTAVAAVEAGSMVLDRRIGNSPNGEVVDYYDEETDITYNALGMPMPPDFSVVDTATGRPQPKDFARFVRKDLQDMIDVTHEQGKPFVLNFAPVTSNPEAEVEQMGDILADNGISGLDGLLLNPACPNIVTADGQRHEPLSHNPALLVPTFRALQAQREWGLFHSVLVRIAPFRSPEAARPMVQVLKAVGVHAVAGFNTFAGGRPQDATGRDILEVPGGTGGQSGRGMSLLAEEHTRWLMEAKEAEQADFAVIGCNGVVDAETMQRRLELGVDATSGTTLFWRAQKNWGSAVEQLLQSYINIT